MIVHQLNLANFRGFEQIELQFEPDVNVIAGVNGVGKSGILQALATLLSHALRAVTPSQSKALHFTDEDIREGRHALLTSARVLRDEQAFDIVVQRSQTDPDIAASARERLRTVRARQSEAAGDKERLRELKEEGRYLRNLLSFGGDTVSIVLRPPPVRAQAVVPAPNISLAGVQTDQDRASGTETVTSTEQQIKRQLRERPNQPLAIFFSPQRHLLKDLRTLPRSTQLGLSAAYQSALEDRPLDLHHFVHWYRVQEHGERHQILDMLQRVVTDFIPEFKALRVETKPSVRFVVEKSGVPLTLNQLSDGERGLLTVIFDITRRLAIANPGLDNPIAAGQATVLIDEIELHLHPTWQRRVLRRFTETFKNCQFIVTTHSPQVLGEVEHRCIRYLMHEDDKIIAWTPQRSLGLDSSRVLEEIMDSKARNAEIEEALNELSRLIDDEDFKAAKQCIEALQVTLGEDDPELTRARALMAFLQGAE